MNVTSLNLSTREGIIVAFSRSRSSFFEVTIRAVAGKSGLSGRAFPESSADEGISERPSRITRIRVRSRPSNQFPRHPCLAHQRLQSPEDFPPEPLHILKNV